MRVGATQRRANDDAIFTTGGRLEVQRKKRVIQTFPIQFSRGSKLSDIEMLSTLDDADLAIFSQEISVLKQSNAYPYGIFWKSCG